MHTEDGVARLQMEATMAVPGDGCRSPTDLLEADRWHPNFSSHMLINVPFVLEIFIPASMGPINRGELYDLPLCDIFDELDDGDVVGGGTYATSGVIESCHVVFETSDVGRVMPHVLNLLESANAPIGTVVRQLEPDAIDLHFVT